MDNGFNDVFVEAAQMFLAWSQSTRAKNNPFKVGVKMSIYFLLFFFLSL